MRVKVTYSVELEDVPMKVSTLLANISSEINSSSELVANSSNLLIIENDTIKSIRDIERAQGLLVGNLEQLDDMKNILIGYQRILLSPEEELQGHNIDPSAQESLEQINQLADQLKTLQEVSENEND